MAEPLDDTNPTSPTWNDPEVAHGDLDRIERLAPRLAAQEVLKSSIGPRAEIRNFDMSESMRHLGKFDLIVSRFAIHPLDDDRKRDLHHELAGSL